MSVDELLFADGPHSAAAASFRAGVRDYVDAELRRTSFDEGESVVDAVRGFVRAGLLRERWSPPMPGDVGRAVVVAEELARSSHAAVSIGIALHVETVVPMLIAEAGENALQREYLDRSLSGDAVGCLAITEAQGGTNLADVAVTAERRGDQWRLRGQKMYVSLGDRADFAMVLARTRSGRPAVPYLTVFLVPRDRFTVTRRLPTIGLTGLDTVEIEFDTELPDANVVGRPGAGLLVATSALTSMRLALAAQAVGAAGLGVGLATTHVRRRATSRGALYERSAVRQRVADLASQVAVVRAAVEGFAVAARPGTPLPFRAVAGLKVVAARMVEHVLSECMHLFGGSGYLVDETPIARMWRDFRALRLTAGTDEMMLELVAGGLGSEDEYYDGVMPAGS